MLGPSNQRRLVLNQKLHRVADQLIEQRKEPGVAVPAQDDEVGQALLETQDVRIDTTLPLRVHPLLAGHVVVAGGDDDHVEVLTSATDHAHDRRGNLLALVHGKRTNPTIPELEQVIPPLALDEVADEHDAIGHERIVVLPGLAGRPRLVRLRVGVPHRAGEKQIDQVLERNDGLGPHEVLFQEELEGPSHGAEARDVLLEGHDHVVHAHLTVTGHHLLNRGVELLVVRVQDVEVGLKLTERREHADEHGSQDHERFLGRGHAILITVGRRKRIVLRHLQNQRFGNILHLGEEGLEPEITLRVRGTHERTRESGDDLAVGRKDLDLDVLFRAHGPKTTHATHITHDLELKHDADRQSDIAVILVDEDVPGRLQIMGRSIGHRNGPKTDEAEVLTTRNLDDPTNVPIHTYSNSSCDSSQNSKGFAIPFRAPTHPQNRMLRRLKRTILHLD